MALSSQGLLAIQISPFLGIIIGGMGPTLSAIVLTIAENGNQGLRNLLRSLLRWRISLWWYLFVLLFPAAIILTAIVINAILNDSAIQFPIIGNGQMVIVTFIVTFILGGPLGEELGWRGYALPLLLADQNALLASLIVGLFWGLWHLPLFWIQGSLQAGIPIVWFMISILAESIIYTWIYTHAKGSLVPMLLLHTSINVWAKLLLLPVLAQNQAPLLLTFGLEFLIAIFIVLTDNPFHFFSLKKGNNLSA